jgi:hypothetical protein
MLARWVPRQWREQWARGQWRAQRQRRGAQMSWNPREQSMLERSVLQEPSVLLERAVLLEQSVPQQRR